MMNIQEFIKVVKSVKIGIYSHLSGWQQFWKPLATVSYQDKRLAIQHMYQLEQYPATVWANNNYDWSSSN